jgi:hypothetical protein
MTCRTNNLTHQTLYMLYTEPNAWKFNKIYQARRADNNDALE